MAKTNRTLPKRKPGRKPKIIADDNQGEATNNRITSNYPRREKNYFARTEKNGPDPNIALNPEEMQAFFEENGMAGLAMQFNESFKHLIKGSMQCLEDEINSMRNCMKSCMETFEKLMTIALKSWETTMENQRLEGEIADKNVHENSNIAAHNGRINEENENNQENESLSEISEESSQLNFGNSNRRHKIHKQANRQEQPLVLKAQNPTKVQSVKVKDKSTPGESAPKVYKKRGRKPKKHNLLIKKSAKVLSEKLKIQTPFSNIPAPLIADKPSEFKDEEFNLGNKDSDIVRPNINCDENKELENEESLAHSKPSDMNKSLSASTIHNNSSSDQNAIRSLNKEIPNDGLSIPKFVDSNFEKVFDPSMGNVIIGSRLLQYVPPQENLD
jgi:hypothetical protein